MNFRHTSGYSYAFEPSLETMSGQTIGQLIRECANDSPDKTAVVSAHQHITKTYAELNSDANKLAIGLKGLGCRRGDRVGIWAINCYEWVITQYATVKIGAILVNVNPGYRANELQYALNLVGCHTLICSQQFRSSNYCKILDNISIKLLQNNTDGNAIQCDKIPSLENIIVINSGDDEPEMAPKHIPRFNDLMASVNGNCECVDDPAIQFDDPINIQFTSGTTGSPKAATLTHHNIIQNAYLLSKRSLEDLELNGLTVCVPPPLYHCFGSIVGSLMIALRRATMVLPAPVFNSHKTLEAIDKYKCHMVYGTPTMFVDLLACDLTKYNTSSLVRGIMGGSPCSPSLLDEIYKRIPTCAHILLIYGATECSPLVTHTSVGDSPERRLKSVGRPIEHVEIKIVEPITGAIQPIGVSGEVCARGHCTDMGFMDDCGYLYINGRINDMIIRGGENIYPKEVEDFLMTHPSIADAHVVGIPDNRLGERLAAYIKLKADDALDTEAVKEYCKGKISHFKIPESIEFVSDFPRTVTGKVQKFKLKELAARGPKRYPTIRFTRCPEMKEKFPNGTKYPMAYNDYKKCND
ncbi:unnamed protein product [Medioppia subpectinata]|uniref:Medium-chain acyl-CoA ligase ACSF2, mitochondrial n=1 Tax=Medioppia subpectinata TaxID=1979941 RepID=A0A7R9PV17_9ACAR|nr:unnamed protein product [Medioppia subpectinata]CAG2102123.1 unnamed protein product [Medioppia subpectinata]